MEKVSCFENLWVALPLVARVSELRVILFYCCGPGLTHIYLLALSISGFPKRWAIDSRETAGSVLMSYITQERGCVIIQG